MDSEPRWRYCRKYYRQLRAKEWRDSLTAWLDFVFTLPLRLVLGPFLPLVSWRARKIYGPKAVVGLERLCPHCLDAYSTGDSGHYHCHECRKSYRGIKVYWFYRISFPERVRRRQDVMPIELRPDEYSTLRPTG